MKRKFPIIIIWILVLFITPITAALPELPAEEGIVLLDKETNTIIYEQNEDQRFEPASITKLLTALVLVDNINNLDEIVTVGDEVNDFTYADSRAMIWQGQQLSYRDLLFAMLVPSGNDAAQSIAVNVGKVIANTQDRKTAESAFINAMNEKATELGLTNSHFVNPHGRSDPNHYTTPEDYIKITEAALSNDEIKNAASAQKVTLKNQDGTDNVLFSSDFCLFANSNEMNGYTGIGQIFPNLAPGTVQENPYYSKYINAAKTGRTDSDERTYAFYSDQNGRDVYGVIFNSKDPFGIFSQSKSLVETLNSNYETEDITEEVNENVPEIENISVLSPKTLNLNLAESELYDDKTNKDNINVTYRFNEDLIQEENGTYTLVNSLKENEKVGSALVNNSNGTVKTIPVYASQDYLTKNWVDFIVDYAVYFIAGALIIIIVGIVLFRKRKKKVNGEKF